MQTRKLKEDPGITTATALKVKISKRYLKLLKKCENWEKTQKKCCYTFYLSLITTHLHAHIILKLRNKDISIWLILAVVISICVKTATQPNFG